MTSAIRSIRSIRSAVAIGLAVAALGACSDDDPSDEATPTTDPTEVETDALSDPFCEGFLGIERAFVEAPEDEAAMETFIDEQIEPNVAMVAANAPEEIADEVQVMTEAIETFVATGGDVSVFQTPEFSEASEVVYGSLDETCDLNVVEFEAVDFAFEGVPDTLPAGPTSFLMTNEGAELHEFSLVKLRGDVELGVEEILALPEEEADQYVETFAGGLTAPAGGAAGTVVDLEPGRWAYVCFIPVGSVGEAEGAGPPHFTEGMAGEFTVE